MFKKIALAVAALIATPALAQPAHPTTMFMDVVQLGVIDTAHNSTVMTYKGKTAPIGLAGCKMGWNPGDSFYLLVTKGVAVVVRKDLIEKAWELTHDNWDESLYALVQADMVCQVVKP